MNILIKAEKFQNKAESKPIEEGCVDQPKNLSAKRNRLEHIVINFIFLANPGEKLKTESRIQLTMLEK